MESLTLQCAAANMRSASLVVAIRSSWAGAARGMNAPAPTGTLASPWCASDKRHAFIQSGLRKGCGMSLLGAVFAGLRPRLSILPSWHAAFLLKIYASHAFSGSELTEAWLHTFLKALLWRSGCCSVERLVIPHFASMACCGPLLTKRQIPPLRHLTAAGWPALHAALSPAPWAGCPSAIARPTACRRTWPRPADS